MAATDAASATPAAPAAGPTEQVLAALGDVTPDTAAPEAPNTTFCIVGGPMGAMEEDAAEYVASKVLSGERTHYTRAELGSWAHSEGSLTVLGKAIASCPGMVEIDFANIVAGSREAQAVAAYRALADQLEPLRGKIRLVDFSYNAIGPRGLAPLRGLLLEQTALEELIMVRCGVSGATQESIADLLLFRGALGRPAPGAAPAAADAPLPPAMATRLRRLIFDNNLAKDQGAQAMARIIRHSPDLEEFQMGMSRVESAGAIALMDAIRALPRPNLRRIDVHDNVFGEAAGPAVAATVSPAVVPALEEFLASDLMLHDGGVAMVARSLLGLPVEPTGDDAADLTPDPAALKRPLRVLSLGGNDVVVDGAAMPFVALLLRELPALQEMRLAVNDMGFAVRLLADALRQRRAAGRPDIRLLDISGNLCHPKALNDVVDACIECGVAQLEIGGNFGSEERVQGWADRAAAAGGATTISTSGGEMEPEEEDTEAEEEEAYEHVALPELRTPADAAVDALADELAKATVEE